ncbi:MAG TPA: TPM domain-containing protein [Candidatus Udaeobacter sp.]|jgi:uncharacterized protein|nr:TPM domain-containing protein [Candidatus Udaeobacter sp.]
MSARRATARPAAIALTVALALTVAGLAFAAPSWAQSADSTNGPPIPAFHGYVNDVAGVLQEDMRAKLESFLDQVEKKAGAEFAVLIMPTVAPADPSDYKVRVFEQWKIGKKGKDNGLLLLIAMDEHQIRFETGYGLEGALPDMVEGRIARDVMAPEFRAGHVDEAVTQGVLAASARIAREANVTLEWNGQELRYDEARGGGGRDSRAVWVIAFIVFAILSRLLRGVFFPGWYVGGRRGGWGGGFGGFGGGFGGFGGGGGGGSFGGFGGGSSGGGGGGGSW